MNYFQAKQNIEERVFVDLLSDSGFKAVYADPANKHLLINLRSWKRSILTGMSRNGTANTSSRITTLQKREQERVYVRLFSLSSQSWDALPKAQKIALRQGINCSTGSSTQETRGKVHRGVERKNLVSTR